MKLALLLVLLVVTGTGCSHAQRPESRTYVIFEDASGIGGSGGHDCDTEHIECFDRCWNRAPPIPSIKMGSGPHHEYCTKLCREEYMECIEQQEQLEREKQARNLRFSSIDAALDWIRNHKTEVAVGTVVIVAGATFVIATGGAGALVLAPLAL